MKRYQTVLMVVFCCSVAAFTASPVSAVVHHDCDWHECQNCHENEDGGCGNTEDGFDTEGSDGTCDHSTGFFWTSMNCTPAGCEITGTIDCPGGDKSYRIHCTEADGGAVAEATRTEAQCLGEVDFGVCTCESASLYYAADYCYTP